MKKNIEAIDVVWTKQFDVNVHGQQYKLFVSTHADNLFYANLLYYVNSSGENMFSSLASTRTYKHQSFIGETENDVLNKVKKWFESSYADFKLVEIQKPIDSLSAGKASSVHMKTAKA